MDINKKSNKKILLFILVTLSIGAIASYIFIKKIDTGDIKTYDEKRDKAFILDAFDKDMYWLVENPEFSQTFMLEHMSPNRDPKFFGKLNIKVIFEGDKHAGFTTYYKKKFYEGRVQFIYVHPNFRNKGYAKKLVKYATDELFKMNSTVVKLDTRVTNYPAIKAYQKVGFKIVGDDGKFVSMQITK